MNSIGWLGFALAFRVFFVAAALAGVGLPLLWAATLQGTPVSGGLGVAWHAHEMVVGWLGAVFTGFLLTAARNWTGRPTVEGWPLAGMLLAWFLGRCSAVYPIGPLGWVPDLVWTLGAAWALGRAVVPARSYRNLGFIALFLGLALTHLGLAWAPGQASVLSRVALDGLLLGLVVISGRIVPLFTRNAVGDPSLWSWALADRAALAAVSALLVADAWANPQAVAWTAGVAASSMAVRAWPWWRWQVVANPLVAVLHAAHGLVVLGLFARALAASGLWLPESAGLHLLTLGGLGTFCFGMMTRVSLGHTGRPLQASRIDTLSFGLVVGAALVRTGWGIWPLPGLLSASAGLFAASSALFLLGQGPALLRPRADGRPG